MSVCEKLGRAHNCSVRIDGVLIQADARQKALQRCVAVPVNEFAIEAATRFIDDFVANRAHVRTRQSMGSLFLLSQSEPGKWRSDGILTTAECLLVIHAVNVISVREIVVDAKGSQVSSCVAWHQGLKEFPNPSVFRTYGDRWIDFGKILANELLDVRIQKLGGDFDELQAVSRAIWPANTISISRDLIRCLSHARGNGRKKTRLAEYRCEICSPKPRM